MRRVCTLRDLCPESHKSLKTDKNPGWSFISARKMSKFKPKYPWSNRINHTSAIKSCMKISGSRIAWNEMEQARSYGIKTTILETPLGRLAMTVPTPVDLSGFVGLSSIELRSRIRRA